MGVALDTVLLFKIDNGLQVGAALFAARIRCGAEKHRAPQPHQDGHRHNNGQ